MNAMGEGFTSDALSSINSEHALLGGLMMDNGLWDHVGDILVADDFFSTDSRRIFTAISGLVHAGKSADVLTVHDKVGDAIDLQRLSDIAQYVPSLTNARHYAEIIRSRSLSRKLMATGAKINEIALDHSRSIAERMDEASGHLMALQDSGPQRDDWDDPRAAAVVFLDALDARASGKLEIISTGLEGLDALLPSGLEPGHVITIAARPSMGKTALAIAIAESVAAARHPVGVLSMEMPKAQIHARRVSMLSRVPLARIKKPDLLSKEDWSRIPEATETIANSPLFVSDQAGLTINSVRTKARRLKRRHGLRLLVIDYVGLMEGTDRKQNRTIQLGEVSRGLKTLAKELGITVLLLAQLNREVEKRTNGRPILSDLRECGDIEQDSDVIVFVHRPAHVKPELGPDWSEYAELLVAKNRDGATGLVDARYQGSIVKFSDWIGQKPSTATRTSGGAL